MNTQKAKRFNFWIQEVENEIKKTASNGEFFLSINVGKGARKVAGHFRGLGYTVKVVGDGITQIWRLG